jgi:CPA2 family monovalent cation:H+ antiporter-2
MRDGYAARLVVDRARALAPRVSVVVRTHSEHERDVLQGMRDTQAVFGELEVAVQMTRYALTRFGVSMREADAITQGLRGRGGGTETRGLARVLPPPSRYAPGGGNARGT